MRNCRSWANFGCQGIIINGARCGFAGVEETYITGEASYEEKFLKYAEILPKLAGNPLYEWTHLELEQIFGIGERLNAESASRTTRKRTKN